MPVLKRSLLKHCHVSLINGCIEHMKSVLGLGLRADTPKPRMRIEDIKEFLEYQRRIKEAEFKSRKVMKARLIEESLMEAKEMKFRPTIIEANSDSFDQDIIANLKQKDLMPKSLMPQVVQEDMSKYLIFVPYV